jgi:hypothetical protein
VFSAAAVYTWADIGKPLIGAYVGGGAAVLLLAVYSAELVRDFKKWQAGRKIAAVNGEQ